MNELLFIRVLNMSLTGSFVILAVLVMRLLLRKAPAIFSYCLWAIVLFRLLCPISFSAVFSPLNALQAPLTEQGRIEYIPEALLQYDRSAAQPGAAADSAATTMYQNTAATASSGAMSSSGLLKIAADVWLAGILIMTLYSLLALIRLKGKLKTASRERDNIYITEAVSTPFVIGLMRPRIYLPSILDEHEMRYILLHEQIHLRRKDHIVKIISFAALCLHWFNPLVWAAFFQSGKDMEMSCDEAVIRKIGSGMKKEYTTSLLCLSTGKRIVNGVPLAFGEGDTGSRIRNVLRYRKPAAFAMGVAALICVIAAVILLANPDRQREEQGSGGFLTFYGVVTEAVSNNTSQQLLLCPGIGEIAIPEAGTIDTYFEPGDERDPHTLFPGDLIAVTFALEKDPAIIDTVSPPRFSAAAESIIVMWQGLTLQGIGNGSQLPEDTYLLTFPGGIVPDVSTASVGDMLSLYWEDPEDEVYLTQIPESDRSRLLSSTPVLAITENEAGGKMLTVGLNAAVASQLLEGFGFHIRLVLEPGEFLTDEDQRAAEEASAYLEAQSRQEPGASTTSSVQSPQGTDTSAASSVQDPQEPDTSAMAKEDRADRTSIPIVTSGNSVILLADIFTVNIRSISRSSGTIDTYLPGDRFPYNSEEPLAFAEDCTFRVNYSMDGADYREVSFDTFAGLIEECPHDLNKPCTLVCKDGLVIDAALESAWLNYGISFSTFVPNTYQYEYLMEYRGESAFEACYSLAGTESADIADCDGIELIEVYTGDSGDGDSGIVMFKNAEGALLCTQGAHISRAGWNNIYLGEKEGTPFLMNVYVEDRWDSGGYGYWVYRLDEQGGIRQIAGSLFEFHLDGDLLQYDDELFKEWADGMTAWLENCHLILSTQDGELRTEKVSEADRYNYETLSLKDREL